MTFKAGPLQNREHVERKIDLSRDLGTNIFLSHDGNLNRLYPLDIALLQRMAAR